MTIRLNGFDLSGFIDATEEAKADLGRSWSEAQRQFPPQLSDLITARLKSSHVDDLLAKGHRNLVFRSTAPDEIEVYADGDSVATIGSLGIAYDEDYDNFFIDMLDRANKTISQSLMGSPDLEQMESRQAFEKRLLEIQHHQELIALQTEVVQSRIKDLQPEMPFPVPCGCVLRRLSDGLAYHLPHPRREIQFDGSRIVELLFDNHDMHPELRLALTRLVCPGNPQTFDISLIPKTAETRSYTTYFICEILSVLPVWDAFTNESLFSMKFAASSKTTFPHEARETPQGDAWA